MTGVPQNVPTTNIPLTKIFLCTCGSYSTNTPFSLFAFCNECKDCKSETMRNNMLISLSCLLCWAAVLRRRFYSAAVQFSGASDHQSYCATQSRYWLAEIKTVPRCAGLWSRATRRRSTQFLKISQHNSIQISSPTLPHQFLWRQLVARFPCPVGSVASLQQPGAFLTFAHPAYWRPPPKEITMITTIYLVSQLANSKTAFGNAFSLWF